MEAHLILAISKRRVYQLMKEGNYINIGKHKFPLINCFINNK